MEYCRLHGTTQKTSITAQTGTLPMGLPPKSYSRVTNPERFVVVQEFVAELARNLGDVFELERTEAYGIDSELEGSGNLVRPERCGCDLRRRTPRRSRLRLATSPACT